MDDLADTTTDIADASELVGTFEEHHSNFLYEIGVIHGLRESQVI